jgi:putative CocE/NonD family hydrolase
MKSSGTAFPPVRYFSMGDNTWRVADNWPPSNSRATWFYLHSGSEANSSRGAGKLNRDHPQAESADVFDSDPAKPVPSVPARAGRGEYEAIWGPVDQSPIDDRTNVLVYSTTALSRPLRFAGPLKAEIGVSASTPDADWVVKVTDVRPDGFAQNLATGIRRGSFRESEPTPTPLVPGKTYNLRVDPGHAAATIAPGHKPRIEIAGSCFPLFDRNTHTGEGPGRARTLVARQRLEHSAKAISRVSLPVIEE